jgi:hypothetical protein
VFTLPDANIDTKTITVQISPSAGNTSLSVYNNVTDILDVNVESEVYYLQENKSGKYQIYFGNDVVGKSLPDGAIVNVTYLLTNGTAANKANNFIAGVTAADSLAESISNFVITPVSAASGGSDRESVDEIKFGAAAQFSTQNRLVSFKDYESYIKKNYPSIDSLSVWGGEDETPPVYGKVYISLKPKTNYFISETEKTRIVEEIIKPKAVVAVDAEIRDPEYLYLLVENYVEYDKRKTTSSVESLKNAIRNSILVYRDTNIDKFDSTFVLSKLQDSIDSVDLNAIKGSETILRLQKRFEPLLNSTKTYEINFNAQLHRGTTVNKLTTSQFDMFDNNGVRRTAQIEETPESFTGVSEIQVVNGGSGYLTSPTVTITGDGTGATATAKITNGKVESITITNRGINYSRAIVTITGGSGYGAAGLAILDGRFGTLRAVYYDVSAQRQVINANAGTINYDTGLVTIDNLRILSVEPTDGLIRVNIEAEKGIIKSSKNTIITIDSDDPASIATVIAEI